MPLYFAKSGAKSVLARETDLSLEAQQEGDDVYTTFSPENATAISSWLASGVAVAACSDLLVEQAAASGDPCKLIEAMELVNTRHVNDGGFRRLTSLDAVHFSLQADWRRQDFRFDDAYLDQIRVGGWLESYPLNPYFDFLGLDRLYCVLTLSSFIDPRRFAVVAGSPYHTQLLYGDYMGSAGPDQTLWRHLIRVDGTEAVNDANLPTRLRRWLLAYGCWNDIEPNEQMQCVLNRIESSLGSVRGRERDRLRSVRMTSVVLSFLYCQATHGLGGSDQIQVLDGIGFADLADAFRRKFSTSIAVETK